MLRCFCTAKIHRATVTSTDLDYEGSLTVDADLLKAAGIAVGEQIQVVNINNGERFVTYAIRGDAGSGAIQVNGAAARLCQPGDMVIIIAYGWLNEAEVAAYEPRVVLVLDKKNLTTTVADMNGVSLAHA